ncbi:hypothetical protein D3C83_84260 [compost metagenome]
MTPPMQVPCPPRYLVSECTTMSAPCSNGRHRYGVGTVLSTMSGAPCACAIFARRSKSVTLPSGLPIDSQKIALVFASTSFSKASGSR